jgi:hypothetical protein
VMEVGLLDGERKPSPVGTGKVCCRGNCVERLCCGGKGRVREWSNSFVERPLAITAVSEGFEIKTSWREVC